MEPVTFSPSCFSVAVAVITPSGPLMLKSQSPATLPARKVQCSQQRLRTIIDNNFAIWVFLRKTSEDTMAESSQDSSPK